MSKVYIPQPDGSYIALDSGSESHAALLALPDDKRPTIIAESDAMLQAWLVEKARKDAVIAVMNFANRMREGIAKSRHYLQSSRWAIQLASAQAIKAGTATAFDLSIMGREARLRGRGETVAQLADKVIANSLAFASVGAAVDGIETATLDATAAYAGGDPAAFAAILAQAKATALSEFIDIFTGIYNAATAQAMAAQFFGG